MMVEQLWEQSQPIFSFCASHVSVVSNARVSVSTGVCILVYCQFFRASVTWFKDKYIEERVALWLAGSAKV